MEKILPGKSIAFEGGDGAGKKTQTDLIVKHLGGKGVNAVVYSYPNYDYFYGKNLRAYLDGKIQMWVKERLMNYSTDFVHDEPDLRMHLARGDWAVFNRSYLSTGAFQSAQGLDYDTVKRILDAIGLPRMNLAVYLKVPVEISMSWKEKQRNGENLTQDIHERDRVLQQNVAANYEKMAAEGWGADKWIIIKADRSPEEVHAAVAAAVDDLLRG